MKLMIYHFNINNSPFNEGVKFALMKINDEIENVIIELESLKLKYPKMKTQDVINLLIRLYNKL